MSTRDTPTTSSANTLLKGVPRAAEGQQQTACEVCSLLCGHTVDDTAECTVGSIDRANTLPSSSAGTVDHVEVVLDCVILV